jgi:hypothetical protein
MTLEPASAVAVAKCMTGRLWRPGFPGDPEAFHPRPCAWGDYRRADLMRMLDDFNDEAGYSSVTDRYRSVEVERFRALSADHQARLVRAAQYPDGGDR